MRRPAPDNTGGIIALVSAHRHTDDWHAEAERRNDGAVATMRNHEISMWEGQQVRTTRLGSRVRGKREYLSHIAGPSVTNRRTGKPERAAMMRR